MNRFKFLALSLFGLLLTTSPGFAATEDEAKRDLTEILAAKKVIVAMVNGNYPPFIVQNQDGSLGGEEVALAQDIAKRLDVKLEILKTDGFDDVIDKVASGEADIGLSNLTITTTRAKKIKYTDTYRTLDFVLLLNRMKMAAQGLVAEVGHMDQVRSTRDSIGVLKKSAYKQAAKIKFPDAKIKTFDDYSSLIEAAAKGEILLAVSNSGVANALLEQNPKLRINLQAYVSKDYQDHIAMAVGLENDHLLSWLNAYLTIKDFFKD